MGQHALRHDTCQLRQNILHRRCQPGLAAIDGDQHAVDSLDLCEALHNALHMLLVNLGGMSRW
eukprot:828034-Amphidinium_carterae.1